MTMATLLEPAPITNDRHAFLSRAGTQCIERFLDSYFDWLDCNGLATDCLLHGSASRGTIAWVVVPNQPPVLVSDIDIVITANWEPELRRVCETSGTELLKDCVGSRSMSPGARVSIVGLATDGEDTPEMPGLRHSALFGGLRASRAALAMCSLKNRNGNSLFAPRDMAFALPYALFRFISWQPNDTNGFAAACYELAKGINRDKYGDSDTSYGPHRFYDLRELQSFVSGHISDACARAFGSEPGVEVSNGIHQIRRLVCSGFNENGIVSGTRFNASELGCLLDLLKEKWPASLLARRIVAFQTSIHEFL